MTIPVELHPGDAAPADFNADSNDGPLRTLWETDHRGMNHYQSPSWYRYVGEGLGSSFGEDWLRFYHPDDRERLQREWLESLKTEGVHPYDIEVRIRRNDGAYRWFRVQGAPLRSRDGQVVKWTGTCTDIHERKLAESAEANASEGLGFRAAKDEAVRLPRTVERRRRLLRPSPLERRLFLIVFVGLLPLALLSFTTLFHNAYNQKQQLLAAMEDTMLAVGTAVDSEIEQSLASLDTLANSPRLAAGDMVGFQAEARELLARRPNWANLVLSDPAAQQVMNAQLPPGSPLPARIDPASIEETVRTRKPGVGNVIFSPVLKMHGFAVRVPILRGGEVAYILSAVVRPSAILEVLRRQRIPENGVVAILDRQQQIVARSLNQEQWVGKPATSKLRNVLQRQPRGGWVKTTTLDGVRVYSIFHRSTVTGWSAAIGIPVETVDGPIQRSYLILGGAIVFSVLLGLFAAFLVGRTITRPIQELEKAAMAVGQGESPPLPTTALPEIRRVALALAAAHIEREKLLQNEREARLNEKEARLLAENASKTKDEFLAMLGHELRNPLAAITTASELLERVDKTLPHEPAGKAKAIIRRQVQHLARLMDDLLDAGRVMMGKISLDRRPIELAATVRAVVDTLRSTGRLAEHGLTLSLDPVWVMADATRIDQIVANLLTNALKYTPPPGSIDVVVERDGDDAVLRVRDSGLGLEADLLPHIFDLFVQGRRSLDRSQGGLGIGLTLVRRLAELHGGKVEASSEGVGKGSEFVVRVPAIEAGEAPAVGAAEADSTQRNIVIVEDNHDVRVALRGVLELEGHRVHEASDGLAGVEVIQRECPDIAFIDIGLPLLDGCGVANAIRAAGDQRVRLIAMTGYGNQEDIRRGMGAGFDAYVVKPIDMAVLNKLIAES